MESKAEQLAKKLLALAKQGVGGEAVNAEQMLKNHCAKHGINIEDLEEEKLSRFEFTIKKGADVYHRLFFQIVSNTIRNYSGTYYKRKLKKVAVDCTAAQAFEIKFKYEHYLGEFKKAESDLYNAFIMAGNLYANKDSESLRDYNDLTQAEKAELRRAERLADRLNIEKHHKRLGE
jgi:hypothetical protein